MAQVARACSYQPRFRGHPRNRHGAGYDMPRLAASYKPLSQFVQVQEGRSPNIDFGNPHAVAALNTALLRVDYGIKGYETQPGHLVPPVPGRADYLHVLADLLAADNDGTVPKGECVRGLDIGCGASMIYALLGMAEYGWRFIGSDISKASLFAARNIASNAGIPIELRQQRNPHSVLHGGVLRSSDAPLAFTLCNPPFYSSAEEAAAQSARRWRNLRDGRGGGPGFGTAGEVWCEGGERGFVTRHIRESATANAPVIWFTSLLSNEKSLPKLEAELRMAGAAAVEVVPLEHGKKRARVLAWSMLSARQRRLALSHKLRGLGKSERDRTK